MKRGLIDWIDDLTDTEWFAPVVVGVIFLVGMVVLLVKYGG